MIRFAGTLEELLQLARQLVPPSDVALQQRASAAQALSLLREYKSGNKIAAIKIVREITGLGLKESKDIVEAV